LAASYPAANTAGNTLIAFVGVYHQATNSIAVLNVSDNAGNTWVRISSAENSTNTVATMTGSMFYAANCAGTTNTITSSASLSSNFLSMWIGEITGAATSSPLEASGSTIGLSSQHVHNSLTGTTASELWVVGITDFAGFSSAYSWTTQAGSSGPPVARTEWSVVAGASFQRIGGMSYTGVSSGANAFQSSFSNSTRWTSVSAVFQPTQGVVATVLVPLRSMMGAGR
jgi:hypothetical protein